MADVTITPQPPIVVQVVPQLPIVVTIAPAAFVQINTSGSAQSYYSRLTISPGETDFVLPAAPAAPSLTQVFLNGVKAAFLADYNVSGYTVRLNSGMPIETFFEVYY